mmetsp:Transcript_52294/g.162341  ORF Transcript_52294/g.162341 Transcript_52294/m.162341 type:complete len:209 (+) Transcript_52294:2000-2626(+)
MRQSVKTSLAYDKTSTLCGGRQRASVCTVKICGKERQELFVTAGTASWKGIGSPSIRRWFYQIWFEHKQFPFSSCSYVQKERYLHLSQNTTLCYSHISASQLTYHLVTPHCGVHKNAIWLRRACDLPATWLSLGVRTQSSCTCRSWTLGDGARTRRENRRCLAGDGWGCCKNPQSFLRTCSLISQNRPPTIGGMLGDSLHRSSSCSNE